MPDPKTYTEDEFNAMVAERDAVKANRDEVLKEAKRAKESLKNYDGVDPEEFKRLKAASEEAERKRASAEGDFKSLEQQLKTLHKQELDAKDVKVGKLTKALEKRAIRVELTTALTKAGVLPDMLDLMVDRGERSARMKETDDDYVAYISDDKGNALVADGAGTPMDFATFVEKSLKTQYPRAFEGTGASGGGAAKSNPSGAGSNRVVSSRDIAKNVDDIIAGKVTVATD